MALSQPTQISPSAFGSPGNGAVDINSDFRCEWQVNGNSAMTAFSITIYVNDTDSTQVYTTGELSSGCPFYGIDYTGAIQFFSYTISSAVLISAGMTNGGEYKLIITQWWSSSDYITQTSASAFITRDLATLAISNLPSPLTSRSYSFLATYTQAQGDALNWVRWQLALSSLTDDPFLDTQEIYGTAELQLDFDGFFTGNAYAVRCMIQTESGVEVDTGWQEFSVSYSSESLSGYLTACRANRYHAVYLAWQNIFYITGEATGSYTISDERLLLPSGSSILWDEVTQMSLNFASPWSIVWQGKVPLESVAPMSIAGASDTLTLEFDSTALYVKLNGTAIYTLTITRWASDIFTVIITAENISVQIMRKTGGLWPRTGLYPHVGLYPKASTYAIYDTDSADISLSQFAIASVTIAGPYVCDFIYISHSTFTSAQITAIMESTTYTPESDSLTYFLCDFSDGLDAGNINGSGGELTDFKIYRMASGDAVLTPIAEVPIADTAAILDYSAASRSTYVYYAYALGESTLSAVPYESNSITPSFSFWSVLECEEDDDDDNVYHVLAEYRFKFNISSGSISNNNKPNLLENFTPYPLRQPKDTNYQSGTLTSLIGSIDYSAGVQYTNTVAQKKAIMALSVSDNTLFLKNPLGDVMMIETSDAITISTNDATAEQLQAVALPWAENGSAEGLSIVCETTDEFWPF